MRKVLISARSVGVLAKKGLEELVSTGEYEILLPHPGENMDEETLIENIKEADALILGGSPVTKRVLDASPNLKIVTKVGIGTDTIDIPEATKQGIVIANTPSANSMSVADMAVGLMLSVSLNITKANNSLRRGEWLPFTGHEVYAKTAGIIGVGRIGKGIARRCRGFDMNLIGYDPYPDESFAKETGLKYVSLEEVFKNADILFIQTHPTPETQGLVNAERLGMMKKSAILINTSRGALVDSKALFEALSTGIIAGAGLDVLEVEPPVDEPLLTLDNVVCTPHLGGMTAEAAERMLSAACKNVDDVLHGRKPEFVVNPEVYENGCLKLL